MKNFYITEDYKVFDDVSKAAIHMVELKGQDVDDFTIALKTAVEDNVFFTILEKKK